MKEADADQCATRCTDLLEQLIAALEETLDLAASNRCLERLDDLALTLRLASELVARLKSAAADGARSHDEP